tara:strand:+ start:15115 stop:20001 length:4887 start_codon:yes stop_codon:yes gene_type:complete
MKMFKRSLVASSIVASLCITSTSYADDIEVKISNSLLDTYTDKYEEADLVVMKLSDIRLSAMAYWAQNESYPAVINDLIADSFYFGTFTTTFGTVINGANNVDSYALTLDLPSPELASYVASGVNGTFNGNTVRLEFGLPMSAIARDVSLSRFDDPANPDLNRMEADINMNGNDVNNVGSVTANTATINGDLVVNSGANTLEMTTSGLRYNGSQVITSDNIDAYSPGEDAVLKSEGAIMNGLYTIQGANSGLTIGDDSRLNFQESGEIKSWVAPTDRGLSIGRGSASLLTVGDGAYETGLVFKPNYQTSVIDLKANHFNTKSKLYLAKNAILKAAGQQTWIGADDSRVNANGGASISTNLVAQDDGYVNVIVGNSTHLNPDYALRATTDGNSRAFVKLMYGSEERLQTLNGGVKITGAVTALSGGTQYFNVSESAFTYKGDDVLTASNFMTYAASSADAVSKTQDGTLTADYIVAGKDENGANTNAGFRFNDGAFLQFKDINSGKFVTIRSTSNGIKADSEVGQILTLDAGTFKYEARKTSNIELIGKEYRADGAIWSGALQVDGGTFDLRYDSGTSFYAGIASRRGYTAIRQSGSLYMGFSDDHPGFNVSGNNDFIFAAKDNGNAQISLLYGNSKRLSTTNSGLDLFGSITSSFDSDADGIADTEYLSISDTSFTYNGADVITAENISTYTGGVTDAVSKSQDGTLRGLYTIDGLEDDGVTPSGAALTLTNNVNLNLRDGSKIIGQDVNIHASRFNKSIVKNGGFYSESYLEYGKVYLYGSEALNIGLKKDTNQDATPILNLYAQDVVAIRGNNTRAKSTALEANFVDGKGSVELMYDGVAQLKTEQNGLSLKSALNAVYDSDGDNIADTEYFSLSESAFTYNGADVITAANITTYTGGVTDAVSKSKDGTLRGLYTIDGLEDDGVTPSGAGLSFLNGATITGDISVVDGNTPYFVVNKSGQGKNGVGLRYQPTGPNTDVIISGKSETGTAELILDGYARLRSINGGDVYIGVADERVESFGGASGKVFVGARNNIAFAIGNSSALQPGLFLEGKNDLNKNAYVSLKYDSETRLNTNSDGIDIFGNFVAAYDSNADGIADTQYLSVDETAFTYNGADVITSANIATYTGGVTDAVSKSQDGTLRGLYTIDGLEDDGVTPSGAELAFNNGASINFQDKSTISANSAGTSFFIDSPDRVNITGGNAIDLYATRGGDSSRLVVSKSSILLSSTEINVGGYRDSDPSAEIVNISSKDQVVIRTGQNSSSSEIVFLGKYDSITNENYAQLLYEGTSKLTTINEGIRLDGGIKAFADLDADGVGETEYFDLSETAFTYNGADVITAKNIGTYIDTTGLVSKSDDGILRGMYTFDGLEEDGVTPSNAGLNFVNGMKIQVNGNDTIFTSNNNRNLNISTVENLHASASVIQLTATKTGNSSGMSLSDVNFVLKSRDIHLGGFGSQESKANLINLSSGEDIVLRTGPLAGNTEIVFLGKFDASTGESYSQMLYESLPRITTTNNGVEINGAISALFDSDADGIGDTEYLNIESDVNNTLTLTAFSDKFEALTYNTDTKIWATNAELSASEISTTTLSAQFITADDVTVNTRLTVEGIDVGQWIKDCEAGISTGCTM